MGKEFASEMLNIDVKDRFVSEGLSEWIQKITAKVMKGERGEKEGMIEGEEKIHYYYIIVEPTVWKSKNCIRLIFKDISELYTRNLFAGSILKTTGLKIKQLYDKYRHVEIGKQLMTPHMMHDFYFIYLDVVQSITLYLSDLD